MQRTKNNAAGAVRDVTASNHVVGQYLFDGEGRRVKKITDSETTIFVYSAGKLIAEYSTQLSATPTVSYTTTDHLGSPRVITDQTGNIIARRDFLPFGEDLNAGLGGRTGDSGLKYSSSTDHIRQKFTGYERDTETSLDFAEARMYNFQHGRFTAVDPLMASGKSANPQTFNRYVYSLNNPLSISDSTGMSPEWVQKDGEVFYDSRVVDQKSATEIYGEGALYRANGDQYSSSAGTKVELGDLGFYKEDGVIRMNGDRAEDALKAQSVGHSGNILQGGLAISGVLLADDLTGIGVGDDLAIPVVLAVTGAAALTAKMTQEISKVQERPLGPQGVQYSLRATANGDYTCFTCSGGTMNLSQGDVWKYGETTNPAGRYSQGQLDTIGGLPVRRFDEFTGNQVEIKVAEKVKIYGYFATHGHLPPGNKIFR